MSRNRQRTTAKAVWTEKYLQSDKTAIAREAIEAIVAHHYIDNFLESFDSIEQAIRIAMKVQNIYRKANFHLKKWTSYRKKVIAVFDPRAENAREVKLNDGDHGEKVFTRHTRNADGRKSARRALLITSIPRLELQAAILYNRLGKTVSEALARERNVCAPGTHALRRRACAFLIKDLYNYDAELSTSTVVASDGQLCIKRPLLYNSGSTYARRMVTAYVDTEYVIHYLKGMPTLESTKQIFSKR
ncbi:hypothetical protein EVAR_75900_1 [Eumeta japonica]|uniref:Uncharacterized protein n=1 Tax=Eumeta variegata TaxID=151549 RepID=A0A4C1UWM9_EUMVA|nr:hypothetical protein EVAR_75900_1 [Eumeta japonica]